MADYTKDTYLLQYSFTEDDIDALIAQGYKAYDRFAEAYLNYNNEGTKPATFTVYGGSYTMKNSEVDVVIAERTNMTISSVLYSGAYYNENTSFALTATDFINNGTLSISKAAEDESEYSVTFTSNATFTNNNSVTVSNAIFDVANVENGATGTFNLTDGALFDAETVTNSGTFTLNDAEFTATTVTNSGTIKLTDAGFGADVANTGAIYVYGKDTEIDGEFIGTGSINYMAGTTSEKKGAGKNKITGDNTINFLTQTDGNRRFFTASDFDVEGTVINIVGTSVSFSGNTTLTADELNVTSYTNEAETKTYAGAVKITGRTVGELIAKNVSLNIGNLNGEITLTNVAIEKSTISGEVQDENNASLVMKDTVSISGENVFNADIANSGTLSIAGSETSLEGVQTLTNSGSGKVTIDDKAEVTVESIVNKNAGLITVSNGATLNAGSISNKKAGSYVQTIAVEGGTLIADSVNTTAIFNVTGASKLEIGAEEGAAGLTGTIVLGDADTAANTATLSGSFVKGGAIDVAGAVTLSDENTLSDITVVDGTLAIAKNATLNASSLTVENTLSLGAGSTVTLTGNLVSSKGLNIQGATVSANAITAEGKALAFITSDITADTITAASAQVRGNSKLNIDHLGNTVMTIKSVNAQTTTTITDSSIDTESSVTTENNVKFVGENTFGAITNKGNLTVAAGGSLTAGEITNTAEGAAISVSGTLTADKVTTADGAFTVADPNTKLIIGKFVGPTVESVDTAGVITFDEGATLANGSTFGSNSIVSISNANFIADDAAVTLTVDAATKLIASNGIKASTDEEKTRTINLTVGTGFTGYDSGLYQLIEGAIDEDVILTVNGVESDSIKIGEDTYGLLRLSNGLFLAKGQTQDELYVDAAYIGFADGTLKDGHIIGYNAFGTIAAASAVSFNRTAKTTIYIESDITERAEGWEFENVDLKTTKAAGVTIINDHNGDWTNLYNNVTIGKGLTFYDGALCTYDGTSYVNGDVNTFQSYNAFGAITVVNGTYTENSGWIIRRHDPNDEWGVGGYVFNGTATLGQAEADRTLQVSQKNHFNGPAKKVEDEEYVPYDPENLYEAGSFCFYSGKIEANNTYVKTLETNLANMTDYNQYKGTTERYKYSYAELILNNTIWNTGAFLTNGDVRITVENQSILRWEGNATIWTKYGKWGGGADDPNDANHKTVVNVTGSTLNAKQNVTNNANGEFTISAGSIFDVEGTLTNNGGKISLVGSTLNATVVDTSAEGATFTVGGTSTLNISGTSSSLTGTITLADDANVTATIVKGGTLNVAAETAATLAAGTSVASAITNAGTLTLTSVTKTGRITNDGTVSGSASTVGGITNNAGSVTLTGKSFSSVSVKAGAVTLNPEDTDTKAIAVGSITNGTKGTKADEAINGSFTANGNVTGSGAITNYAGSINVTGSLTLTENKTTKVLPAITNGSIYTSGTTVRVGVGSIEVTGDLTAGNIVNGIENGATEPAEKSFITAANITADSITNYGTIGSQATGKNIDTLELKQRTYYVKEGEEMVPHTTTGALINKKDGEVFAGTLNAASIENEGGIDVGAINITSEDGTFVNEAGAKAVVGVSVSANAITNNGYLQTGEEGTITATALTNGAYNATTGDGFIEAGSIEADGDIDNAGQVTVSGDISGASIINAGSIEADSIVADTIVNGIAATTEPAADEVEGTITAGSIEADGDITNNAGEIIVTGNISGASISNAGTIEAGSIDADAIDNSGSIGAEGKAVEITTTGDITNNGTINASSISAGNIVNTDSISAVNVTAATVTTNAAGASFNVSGTASLDISKKLTGTITLDNGAIVTANVKGGTLDVENGSTVSIVGSTGNTAAVTNLGKLTIAGGVIGAVTNKQVVVDETTVSGTLTVAAAVGAAAIQTGAFVNNADVNVKSEFTVKGNFTNNGTITIDASKFNVGTNTVKVISVTGTLTNNGDIVVNDPKLQVFVKNDGDNKGVYLFGGDADMTELLVYSDLANEYDPGESFSFAGHGYVYAVNAFTSANAITQIAEDTEFIHFVPQEDAYGNLNLNLSATQDLTVDMINATGRLVAGTFNFNNLIIASEVTEPNDDDEGITAGSIEFINDVATGTNATVSIAAATAVFEDADFSESKSVTIQENADVTFGKFSAKAVTIDDSVVSIEEGATANTVTIKNGSEVDFEGAVTIGIEGSSATVLSITGDSRVNSDELTKTDATIVHGNVVITNSDMDFDGVATINGNVTISGTTSSSEVEFDRDTTISGKLTLGANSVIEADQGFSFTASSSEINGEFYATNKDDENPSGNMTVVLGTLTGKGKIYTDVSSTLAFTLPDTKPFTGTIDVDVTGLTATKNTAPATITGITEGLRNNNLTISGKNASNNWKKYFAFDAEGKTLTLIKEATNVITATGNTAINKALNYSWKDSDENVYYADNVVIEGGATSTLFLQGNGSYVTLVGEYTVGIYGGKYTEATTSRTGVNLGGDINIAIEGGSFTKVVVGGDRINVASGRAVYYREHEEGDLASINLTIDGGTFGNYVATGIMYQGENLQGSVEVGSTNLKINGGSFAKDVYGGNYGNKKSSSSCTFVESSNVTLTVGGAEKINMAGCLFVGSFGSGKVETTKLTLAGQSTDSDALVVKEIWGGCGSDYNKDDGKGGTTYETAVSGSRTLSFTGFQAAINSRLVSGFSDVEVLSNGEELLDEDRFDTNATLQNTVRLSNVENWTFEAGSTLNGAFINDFAGDTLTLKGIGDYFEATGLDSWTLFGDTTNFAGFDSFKSDSVKFDGVGASFEEGAWVTADYKLSIDENNAMVLSQLA